MTSIAYISPWYPCISSTFECYELEGLRISGTNVDLFSCRKPDYTGTMPYQHTPTPFSFLQFTAGLFKCIRYRKIALARITIIAFWEVLLKLRRSHKTIGSWMLAICFSNHRNRYQWKHIHSDFGMGSATTGFFLATLLNIPFSIKIHAFEIYSNDKKELESRWIRLLKYSKAHKLFFESQQGCDTFQNLFGEIDSEKLVMNPLPVPLQRRKKRGSKIVTAGRLVEKKGIDTFIKAINLVRNHVPEAEFEIWGDGPERESLRRTCEIEGVNPSILKGRYAAAGFQNILSDALMFVAPCREAKNGDMDGTPTTILEAMAIGVPVITTHVGGIPSIATNDSSIVIDPDNPQSLADAILRMFMDEQLRNSLSETAQRQVRQNNDPGYLAKELTESVGLK